jgi:hypothetical protein
MSPTIWMKWVVVLLFRGYSIRCHAFVSPPIHRSTARFCTGIRQPSYDKTTSRCGLNYLWAASDPNSNKQDDPPTNKKDRRENKTNDPKMSLQERIDIFLDTPFFDPNQVLREEEEGKKANPMTRWFANLTVNDYITAESLFAAAFITIMVVATQELLRMQLYGDNYAPFRTASRLF